MPDEEPETEKTPLPAVQPLPLKDDEIDRLGRNKPREELKALEPGRGIRIGQNDDEP